MIPASVTSIGGEAFYNCTGLTSVTFDENGQLAEIGKYAFYNCTGLASITIPSSVTSIGTQAFYLCSSLKSVTFEVTEGWRYHFSSTDTSSTSISATRLADPATAASCLTSRSYGYYADYYWKRG